MEALPALLDAKIKQEDISIREAARNIGIAHTSLIRILNGENCSLPVLIKIARWLDVEAATFINSNNDLANQISFVVQSYPELESVFSKAMQRILAGKMRMETMQELVAYMSYRINLEGK